MKTSHIVTISAAGAIATLLIGGGAFAAGSALGQSGLMPFDAGGKIQERLEQRGEHQDSPLSHDQRGQRPDRPPGVGRGDHPGVGDGDSSGYARMGKHRGPGHQAAPGAQSHGPWGPGVTDQPDLPMNEFPLPN